MDAPLYQPAIRFEAPVRVARAVNTRNTPIADLVKIPAAWAIIVKEMPDINTQLDNEMLKPHLGNFSFRSLVQFGFAKPADLDRIDEKLSALGEIR